jgi:hypothetical protein
VAEPISGDTGTCHEETLLRKGRPVAKKKRKANMKAMCLHPESTSRVAPPLLDAMRAMEITGMKNNIRSGPLTTTLPLTTSLHKAVTLRRRRRMMRLHHHVRQRLDLSLTFPRCHQRRQASRADYHMFTCSRVNLHRHRTRGLDPSIQRRDII